MEEQYKTGLDAAEEILEQTKETTEASTRLQQQHQPADMVVVVPDAVHTVPPLRVER